MSNIEEEGVPNRVYLGDAVYAYYNGYSIELTLDNHTNPPLITLEPEVLIALIKFTKRVNMN